MTNRLLSLPIIAAALIATAACGSGDSSLTIYNDSDYAFLEINLSPTSSSSWGEDLLGAELLLPGEAIEIGGIDCDDYDVRIVDEDGDECIVDDFELCLDNEDWVIDNAMLAVCTF